MTNKQRARAIAVALMVVTILLTMALPAAAQESAPLCHCAGVTVERLNNSGLVRVEATFVGEGIARLRDRDQQVAVPGTEQAFADNTLTWEVVLTSVNYTTQISTDGGNTWESQSACRFVIPPPLSVTLLNFAAVCQVDEIIVTWETGSEIGNTGFNLIRSEDETGQTLLTWFIPSLAPGGTGGALYSFTDTNTLVGQTYWYWLESVDLAGVTVRYGPEVVGCEPPTAVTVSNFTAMTSPRAPMPWCLSAAVLTAGGMFIVFRHGRRRHSKF